MEDFLKKSNMKSEKECYRYNKSSRVFTDRAMLICEKSPNGHGGFRG